MIPLAGAIMTPSLITFLRQSGWGWPRILIVLLLRACWLPQPLVAILIGRRSRLSSRWSFIVGMFGVILFITGFCLIDPRAHGVLTWSQLFILGLLSLAASFLHIAAGLLYRQMRELSPAGGTSSFTTLTIK